MARQNEQLFVLLMELDKRLFLMGRIETLSCVQSECL